MTIIKSILTGCMLLSALLLSSCSTMGWLFCPWCEVNENQYQSGKAFDYTKASQIKPGMHVDQVIGLIGKPYTISASSVDKQWIWTHTHGEITKVVVVQFKEGVVSHVQAKKEHHHNNFDKTY